MDTEDKKNQLEKAHPLTPSMTPSTVQTEPYYSHQGTRYTTKVRAPNEIFSSKIHGFYNPQTMVPTVHIKPPTDLPHDNLRLPEETKQLEDKANLTRGKHYEGTSQHEAVHAHHDILSSMFHPSSDPKDPNYLPTNHASSVAHQMNMQFHPSVGKTLSKFISDTRPKAAFQPGADHDTHIGEISAYASSYLHDPKHRQEFRDWAKQNGLNDKQILGFDNGVKQGFRNVQRWYKNVQPQDLVNFAHKYDEAPEDVRRDMSSYTHWDKAPLNDQHKQDLMQFVQNAKMRKSEDMSKSEKIPGGLAEGKTVADIATHHGVDVADVETQLTMGVKVEMEHTTDKAVAREIAMDHLWEDPKYYDKLETMEAKKCEAHIEVAPDGKREIVPGKEPLKKEPMGKSMIEWWNLLKAKISADDAFLDIEEAVGEKKDEPQPEQAPAGEGEAMQGQAPPEQGQEQAPPEQAPPEQGQEQAPPEQAPQSEEEPDDSHLGMQDDEKLKMLEDKLRQDGFSESEIAHVIHGHIMPTPTLDDHKSYNERADGEMDRTHAQAETALKHDHMKKINELEQARKKAELDSIDPDLEKDHSRKMKELEQAKRRAELESLDPQLERDHKRKMKDLEYDRAKKQADSDDHELEKEHKQKMRDLELEGKKVEIDRLRKEQDLDIEAKRVEIEIEKKAKELELKYKEKELQLNLKLKEEAARQKAEFQAKQAEEDAKVNAACKKEQAKFKIEESKKPPVKEKTSGKDK